MAVQMNDIILVIEEEKQQLLKALNHLAYSYHKIKAFNQHIDLSDDENLETWESFSFRFARVVDIFLAKFVRSYNLYSDPGFNGTLRDHINFAQKSSLIDGSNWWLGLRELRNIAAHEYNENDLKQFYTRLFSECPRLLKLEQALQSMKL